MRSDRIPEIKSRVNLEAIVTADAGPPAKVLSGVPRWHCPLPDHDDRDPSFQVLGDRWRCWSGDHGPKSSGDVIDYIALTRRLNMRAAIDLLADEAALTPVVPPRPTRVREMTREGFHADRSHFVEPGRAVPLMREYLTARSLPPEAEAALGLRIVSDAYHLKRVRYGWEGAMSTPKSYWADRAVDGRVEPRWMLRGGHIPSPYLSCTLSKPGPVTICEGVTDAALLHLAYPDAAVCGIPGMAWQREWASLLARRDVLLVTDTDPAGEGLRRRVAADLRRAGAWSCASIRLDEAANDVCGLLQRAGSVPVFRVQWEAHLEDAQARRQALLRGRRVVEEEEEVLAQ